MTPKGRLLTWAALCTSGVLVVLRARRLTRLEVVGESMLPTLRPGDWLVVDSSAYEGKSPRRGDIVAVPDPRSPGRLLVKRVGGTGDGGLELLGDNPGSSTDSRTFGLVPASEVQGRVVARYWPRPRLWTR